MARGACTRTQRLTGNCDWSCGFPRDPVKNTRMGFRFKAFAWHLLGSATALSLTLGLMYLGWYHWPGWYLADMPTVLAIMVGVDVVLGPLLTLIVADPAKARRVFVRDVGLIVLVQLVAFTYGVITLWNGRPLYYAYSENCLSVVQAQDLERDSVKAARAQSSPLAPHWYSLPRWIWAPLPKDAEEAGKIVQSALAGGYDVTALPLHYRPWASGTADLRSQLKRVDDIGFFSLREKKLLKERMAAAGLAVDRADAIALTGRKRPLLVVFDPSSLRLLAYIQPD